MLSIPCKELAIIRSLCVVYDAEQLLNRVLFGEKFFFWNISLKWFREISVHRAWVQQNAYNWILLACKFHRHILCYCSTKTWLAWTKDLVPLEDLSDNFSQTIQVHNKPTSSLLTLTHYTTVYMYPIKSRGHINVFSSVSGLTKLKIEEPKKISFSLFWSPYSTRHEKQIYVMKS